MFKPGMTYKTKLLDPLIWRKKMGLSQALWGGKIVTVIEQVGPKATIMPYADGHAAIVQRYRIKSADGSVLGEPWVYEYALEMHCMFSESRHEV
jgi:hypothetical protein